jgi:hypothetical protein
MLVSFGNASGPVPPFDPLLLSQKGSLFLTRPTLMHYTAKRADLAALGAELFDVVGSGKVKIEVNQTTRWPKWPGASRPRSTQAYRIDHPAALMERLRARLVALRYMLATAWPIVLITAIGLHRRLSVRRARAAPHASPSPPAAKPAPTMPMPSAMRPLLAARGITLEVMTSAGSHQNLERLEKVKPTLLSCRGALVPGHPRRRR